MARSRLDVVLVERGLFDSRAKAVAAIAAGNVQVEGRVAAKPAEMVDNNADIVASAAHPWVGRGALKLDHALSVWPIAVEGRVVLDVGASTGGFTEVCLGRGARKVYAVDVGRGQLHGRIKADSRVIDLEATDARKLNSDLVPEPVDLIVCDVSFIGLAKALPAALVLASPEADLVVLVKPQFEVGPSRVGKGGVVKDEADRQSALGGVRDFLEAAGWQAQATTDSPVLGADGNREWLLWMRRGLAVPTG